MSLAAHDVAWSAGGQPILAGVTLVVAGLAWIDRIAASVVGR